MLTLTSQAPQALVAYLSARGSKKVTKEDLEGAARFEQALVSTFAPDVLIRLKAKIHNQIHARPEQTRDAAIPLIIYRALRTELGDEGAKRVMSMAGIEVDFNDMDNFDFEGEDS